MAKTISDDDEYALEMNGIDPNDIQSTSDDNTSSGVLAALPKSSSKTVSGSSPLTSSAFSNNLLDKAEAIAPQREDVLAKRQALMDSFKTLMNAQAYRGPAVRDPEAVATAAALLKSNPNSSIGLGLGNAMEAGANVRQGLQDKQQQADLAQAGTGKEASNTDLGFLTSDQTNSMDLLKQAALTDNKNETLQLRMALAEMGKNQVVYDNQHNVIGTFNKVTGNIDPVGGAGTGSAAGGIRIPGVNPSSPEHAGLAQIVADTGIDPSTLANRSRADITEATKDSVAAKKFFDAAKTSAQTATEAAKDFANGTPGFIDHVQHGINYYTNSNLQGGTDYDLINKYNKQMAGALASQMPGMRLGIGMDKFLADSTFNSGMSKDAAMTIINKLKDVPYLAQRNLDLENLTNSLPISAKNAIYSEFINDNPQFVEDKDGKQIINPAYKDKAMVKKWLTSRAGGTGAAGGTNATGDTANALPSGFTQEEWDVLTPEEKASLK